MFDKGGRLTEQGDALGQVTRYGYEPDGLQNRVDFADGTMASAAYGPVTRSKIQAVDLRGHVYTYGWDALKRLERAGVYHAIKGGQPVAEEYEYDPSRARTRVWKSHTA